MYLAQWHRENEVSHRPLRDPDEKVGTLMDRFTKFIISALYSDLRWRTVGEIEAADAKTALSEWKQGYQRDMGELPDAWKALRAKAVE
jgi:hypothetical protein